jgi:hypothetical protein
MKATVLTNIYNEEYLLPFWLEHHKKIFDHGIIIDYWSTDKSVEICKQICPTWEVRTTTNPYFGAIEIDIEFMEIEKSIEGIKMHLNTTEFLFIDKPLSELFNNEPISYGVRAYGAYSKNEEYPTTMQEIVKGVLHDDVRFIFEYERGRRQIHTYPTGRYKLGRHSTHNPSTEIINMAILWLGYYPWNNKLIDRKLQIKTYIPASDREKGYSYNHFYDTFKIESIRKHWVLNGRRLEEEAPNLQRMLVNYNNLINSELNSCPPVS